MPAIPGLLLKALPSFNNTIYKESNYISGTVPIAIKKNGSGLGLVYPPLDTSDYMQNNLAEVLCLMRNGTSGEMIVNGKSFNQAMPGISTLSDLEIAEIATYIYNSWSHRKGIVEVKAAEQMLSSCDSVAVP